MAKSWARLKETIFTDFIPAPLAGIRVFLPFVWAKRTVNGLSKWRAKFRTGKFHRRSRIYHLYKSVPFTEKKGHQSLKLVSNMALSKWNTNFRVEYYIRKKQDYLFRFSVAAGNFPPDPPKRSCYIYFPTGYSGNVLWIVNKHGLTLKFLQAPE